MDKQEKNQNKHLPTFIQSVSNDLHMLWQTEVQLHNFRKLGYSSNYRVLIFVPKNRQSWESTTPDISGWEKLNQEYPEAKFFYYYDEEDILNSTILQIGYIPLIRLYCLKKHFAEYPELSEETIFYHDADIIFTKEFPFNEYLHDDICYLSNTGHYLGLGYLDSKIEHSLPNKRDKLISINPVERIANSAGITRKKIEENDAHTGGAQYLLKGIDAKFWQDCYDSCIRLKFTFNNLRTYFKDSNTAYQGFCSDMWAVLYTLWKHGKVTRCPSDFNFAWATDKIEKLENCYIYHNAGISNKVMNLNGQDEVVFFKGLYANNDKTPFDDKVYLEVISPRYANKFYAETIKEIKNPVSSQIIK